MRLIAAVSNFNGAANLEPLLHSLVKQGFEALYVLDDASTDDSRHVSGQFKHVVFIAGKERLGPGGNRNRIMPYLRPNDYIFFIDADMELLGGHWRKELLNILDAEPTVGIVGGLVLTKKGTPMRYNYGHFANPWRDAIGVLLESLAQAATFPLLRHGLQRIAQPFTYNLLIRFEPPARRPVEWTSSSLCVVRGDVFKEVGGFAAELQYHESQVLSARFYRAGFSALFWPTLHARHLEFRVRPRRLKYQQIPKLLHQQKTGQ